MFYITFISVKKRKKFFNQKKNNKIYYPKKLRKLSVNISKIILITKRMRNFDDLKIF